MGQRLRSPYTRIHTPDPSIQRTAYDDHGVVVEYGSHIYAAARYSFQMSLLSI
jgi:DNA-binding GntR family transcriptional regulator